MKETDPLILQSKDLDIRRKVVKNKMPGLFSNRTGVSRRQREWNSMQRSLPISTDIYDYVL